MMEVVVPMRLELPQELRPDKPLLSSKRAHIMSSATGVLRRLGLVQEWRPDQTPTSFNRVALLQLATARLAVLVRTCRMRFQLAPCLANFLRCSVLCTLCVSYYVPPFTVEPCYILCPPVCVTLCDTDSCVYLGLC